jgi:hypothetical protein
MTQASLRTVTLKTVANYHHAAEHAVGAYRLGGHRLIAVMRQSVDIAARRGAERFAPRLAAAIQRAGDSVGSLVVKGIDAVSHGTTRVLTIGTDGVRSQVERVAVMAGGVDYPVVVSGLQAAARFSLPGAQAALALSERVAAGAAKLETVAAGPRSTRAKAAAQRVRRGAPARGRSTVAKVEAEVKAVSRRATKAVKQKVGKTARRVSDAAEAVAQATAPKAARKPVARAVAKAPKVAAKPVRRAAVKAAGPVSDATEAVAA